MPLKPTTDPSSLSFPDEEVKTLAFWEEIDAFQTALKNSEGKPEYTFYDGPPFATGTPHYGHILAGTIKDTMTRYAHQNGFHVPRRFGWDCHGLPIEFEIDKQEGIKTRDDVLAIGIDKYNEMCRSIVMRFSAEWKTTVTRLGRWIDMENDYKTMDTNYMESVWWAFKTMFDKGYVYRGFKVMPYSTACGTPLSNFEAGMNYKDVNDPEVYATFPLVDEPDVNLVAWTTTPWTLPSNLALCVNPEMDYVKIKDKKTEKIYIVAKARVTEGFYTVKKGAALPYDVLDEFKGAALEGRTYQPLFDYFVEQFQPQGAFKVVCDSYVTSTSGTGIVHQAPAFGEDDNRVCARYGIVIKGGEIPCPLDANGRFTAPVEDFKGEYIKDADKGIMAHLKKVGRLYKSGTISHSYPFCWRSDTPLIYRAIPSWFVRVESIRERLIANNDSTYWVPSFVKDNRFKNWLADARDWAVSRNRFWGTPLPIWANDDYSEIVAIGSIDELEQLSGVRVTDLHRHNIDHITIPSKSGEGVLRRTPEIFDCWLESGCMPYAQLHYPFENKERFEAGFPADFIAEGIDQTRGWFYTLMVISTILFDRPPFKNVIVNGIVLNKEGKKMSKREKNYPDPNLVINSYGSDSLRLYLVNSPVVRGDDLKFDEAGVRAISRDVLRLWYSSYHFLVQSILQHEARTGSEFTPNLSLSLESGNLMDKWILANLQSLIAFVDVELKAYHLYTVVPRLVAFLEELNNWYIKLNRPRLRGKNGEGECLGAVNALYEVLMTMCKAMAPFVPFITEHIYQNLRLCLPEDQRLQSVHFTSYPQPNELLVDKNMVENFKNLQAVINLGRTARERRTMPLRLPLKEVTIIHKSQEVVDNLQILVKYIEEGLSVSKVNLTTLEAEYVSYSISLNQRAVGKRLRGEKAKVEAAVKQLTQEQIRAYAVEQRIELEGHVLEGEDLIAVKVFNGNKEIMEADWDANFLIVLNLTVDRDQQMQCLARGTKNRVQRFRKKAGIKVGDDIVVYHQAKEDSDLSVAINELSGFIQSEIGVPFLPFSQVPADAVLSEPEVGEVEDIPLTLWIHKK